MDRTDVVCDVSSGAPVLVLSCPQPEMWPGVDVYVLIGAHMGWISSLFLVAL